MSICGRILVETSLINYWWSKKTLRDGQCSSTGKAATMPRTDNCNDSNIWIMHTAASLAAQCRFTHCPTSPLLPLGLVSDQYPTLSQSLFLRTKTKYFLHTSIQQIHTLSKMCKKIPGGGKWENSTQLYFFKITITVI